MTPIFLSVCLELKWYSIGASIYTLHFKRSMDRRLLIFFPSKKKCFPTLTVHQNKSFKITFAQKLRWMSFRLLIIQCLKMNRKNPVFASPISCKLFEPIIHTNYTNRYASIVQRFSSNSHQLNGKSKTNECTYIYKHFFCRLMEWHNNVKIPQF